VRIGYFWDARVTDYNGLMTLFISTVKASFKSALYKSFCLACIATWNTVSKKVSGKSKTRYIYTRFSSLLQGGESSDAKKLNIRITQGRYSV